ncbi:hypothetical protein [Nocardioides albus]|uniref:Uncharacterized protein n=1 Tax=Nocardioides albus TaxID=1841 RepID=A0A7W5F8K3_9ACTN|nr:hypothetical protein [Nocardioides albus]MBB3089141.1 hypothetical protein [Nocardioides albus]GGU13982.1 hypothetical protein GCM10007979_10450 [Nocardioides albus]
MKLFVRLAALLGGSLLFSIVVTRLFPTEDADIGAGLIFFALLLTVSGLWGLWDGYHASRLPVVFVRWAVIAVVVGLSGPVRIWVEEGRDLDVLWSDLVNLTPLIAGLVLVPAAVGIGIGHSLNSGRRIERTPHHTSL